MIMAARKRTMKLEAFRLPKETVELIDAEHKELEPEGWSRSDVVREALEKGLRSLARERKKKAKK